MHRTRMMVILYAATGIVAAFLSWVSQSLLGETSYLKGTDPGYAITKMNMGDGWLTGFCFLVVIIAAIGGKREIAVNRKKNWWIALFALVSLIIGLYHLLTILTKSRATTGDPLVMKVAPGVGLYLTVFVSVALILLPLRYKLSGNSLPKNDDK